MQCYEFTFQIGEESKSARFEIQKVSCDNVNFAVLYQNGNVCELFKKMKIEKQKCFFLNLLSQVIYKLQ